MAATYLFNIFTLLFFTSLAASAPLHAEAETATDAVGSITCLTACWPQFMRCQEDLLTPKSVCRDMMCTWLYQKQVCLLLPITLQSLSHEVCR